MQAPGRKSVRVLCGLCLFQHRHERPVDGARGHDAAADGQCSLGDAARVVAFDGCRESILESGASDVTMAAAELSLAYLHQHGNMLVAGGTCRQRGLEPPDRLTVTKYRRRSTPGAECRPHDLNGRPQLRSRHTVVGAIDDHVGADSRLSTASR